MSKRSNRQRKGQNTDRSKSSQKTKPLFGVAQFAERRHNIQIGCEYGCFYCFAGANATGRFKWTRNWTQPVINEAEVNKGWRYVPVRIMFPTSHDITPLNLDEYLTTAKKILETGRELLVVTKPNLDCTRVLCKELAPFRDQIVLRFTITSCDYQITRRWEPNSPLYGERMECLIHAFEQVYNTSVLIEPLLDPDPFKIVADVDSFVTDTIWIGMMKHGRSRMRHNRVTDPLLYDLHDELMSYHHEHWDEFIDALKDNPRVRWKDIDDAEY